MRYSFLCTILLASSCFTVTGQETSYTPEGGFRPSKGKIDIESVRLLTAQDIFDRNISAKELASFIRSVQKSAGKNIPSAAPAFELLIQVTLSSAARAEFELSSQGNPSEKMLQNIYDSLQKLPDVRSKADSLAFQIHLVIKPKP